MLPGRGTEDLRQAVGSAAHRTGLRHLDGRAKQSFTALAVARPYWSVLVLFGSVQCLDPLFLSRRSMSLSADRLGHLVVVFTNAIFAHRPSHQKGLL